MPSAGQVLTGQSLLSQKFSVKAYDIYQPSVDAVVQRGAIPCSDPKDAAVDVDVLGLMVVNAAQVEDIVTKVSGGTDNDSTHNSLS